MQSFLKLWGVSQKGLLEHCVIIVDNPPPVGISVGNFVLLTKWNLISAKSYSAGFGGGFFVGDYSEGFFLS